MASVPGIIIGIISSAVVAVIFFKAFFEGKAHFWECVKYGIKPDFFSWLDKDLQRDYSKSMRLRFYILLCVGSGCATYLVIESLG